MAKKKRSRTERTSADSATPGAAAVRPSSADARSTTAVTAPSGFPPEAGSGIAIIFALMMFLAPALGVPHEEMLQDTLKSIVVSFAVLGAALLFFWQQRDRTAELRWHAVVW